ncbi:N-acetyllactosaminide 3-alpha-galactosyltransferase [Cooperia oncophora]
MIMRTLAPTATLRNVKELIVIANGYIILKISFCTEMLDIDEDPSLNRIQFRNATVLFRYLLLPNTSKCNGVKSGITILVLTTPERAMIRQAIRNSWASAILSKSIRDGFVSVFFFVGAPKSEKEMSILLAEQENYHDLIVTDMKELYENLVFKVNAMMNFFLKYCSNANFLLKIDDDVTIHLDRMLTYWNKSKHDNDRIYCLIWSGAPAIRDPSSKWFIPQTMWPKKMYPSYCDGPIYLMGKHAMNELLRATPCYSPFPLEDVFYTGIVATAVGITRVDWRYKIQNVDEMTWERRIYCDGPHNPVTFAISSFKTAASLMTAYHLLDSFTCYNGSTSAIDVEIPPSQN